MANFKVKVSYLGFLYYGWAKQINKTPTLQEVIENNLEEVIGEKVNIYCSGRTDKMVNAHEQVFSFKLKNNLLLPIKNLILTLNKRLNELNINIIDIEEVDESFHARFSAKSKVYRYYINTNKKFDIFKANFQYQLNKPLNLKKLEEASKIFVGQHDFLSFSTSELLNTTRIINFINILKDDYIVIIEINGNGFLKNMVRMIVASLIKYSQDKITIERIKWLLDNPKKGAANDIASPNGLSLFKVNY